MNYVGISCGYHDAAITVVSDTGDILFASHSERYSKVKHDKNLSTDLIKDAMSYVTGDHELHYYEKPVLKYMRQLRSGEYGPITNMSVRHQIGAIAMSALDSNSTSIRNRLSVHTHSHHLSHAAAGFQTSPFNDATVVVIDAIGEFETITIWSATYNSSGKAKYKKLWSKRYPDSIGLFYSAMTKRLGLRPLDEEYIVMGMAAYGKPIHCSQMAYDLIENGEEISFKHNLHLGVPDDYLPEACEMDLAHSTQLFAEQLIEVVMRKAAKLGHSKNLVYGGGVALNCSANRLLHNHFDKTWIMPNPGDAGSSLGAAALGYGRKLNWKNAFLGHDIQGQYPSNDIIDHLLNDGIVGVANGRAEFGPRSLGNRSLLADPRGPHIKDKVNEIKQRQQFRPFAPVILEEMADEYFDMSNGSSDNRYMQFVAHCRNPELFPAIVHVDGTSRVQTVPADGSGIRELLEKWYILTGCPMLLNTSLNVRGQPVVNDEIDAANFTKLYGIPVLT